MHTESSSSRIDLDSSAGGYGAVAIVAFNFTESAKKIGAQRARQPKYDWYISTYFLRSERQPSNKRSNEKKWLEASEEMARRQWSNFMLYGSFLVKSSRPYALDSNGRGCRCLELPETVLYCSSNQKSKYTIAIVAASAFFFFQLLSSS